MRFTVADLAGRLGCAFEGDGAVAITGVAGLEDARPGDLVFLAQAKLRPLLDATRAAAVVLAEGVAFSRLPVIRAADPQRAFLRAVALFHPAELPPPGVHPTAVVSPAASIGRGVSIGPLCVVGEGASIGDRTVLYPSVAVYARASVGADCVLHSGVSLREGVRVGDRVVLHNGVVIGADGFGYLAEPDGARTKIPQVGTAIVEDDVEIGANSCVDRATLGATIVRRGAKIDDLVMIGHNVEIGEHAVLMAQAGIAGSSKIGRGALLCGQAGIADHLVVGEGAIVAAKSGVTGDVPPGELVSGSPHLAIRDWRKFWASAPRLYDLVKEFKRLRARVEELEKKA